ncbi:MAG: alpha/beta fold hydrolase [bacterium]
MSTPPYLGLPDGARRVELTVARGSRAAIALEPDGALRGTAVLIPGFTGSKEDFIALLEPLAARGWRAVAYDQLGQLDSVGPDDDAAYALVRLGEDARDIAHAAGPGPVHVVGHSLGGLVARSAVIDAGAASLDSVTLLCSGPAALPPERHGAIPALVAVLPEMDLADIWRAKEAMDRDAGWEPPSPEVHEFLRHRFCSVSPRGLRAMGEMLLHEPDRTAQFSRAGIRVHGVHGEHDAAWPLDEQDRMARALGTVPLVIPGAGHSPAVDDPDALADVLDGLWRA